ncbi:hypothetical protein Maes01_02268 [Microbulbifer aestuariivivens]|uniref:Uncharacterized protein n=1 Tax=Microbulbifer aestuariivivens TaxID=1908308 RepID=A0ABP9WTA0_9GAMM
MEATAAPPKTAVPSGNLGPGKNAPGNITTLAGHLTSLSAYSFSILAAGSVKIPSDATAKETASLNQFKAALQSAKGVATNWQENVQPLVFDMVTNISSASTISNMLTQRLLPTAKKIEQHQVVTKAEMLSFYSDVNALQKSAQMTSSQATTAKKALDLFVNGNATSAPTTPALGAVFTNLDNAYTGLNTGPVEATIEADQKLLAAYHSSYESAIGSCVGGVVAIGAGSVGIALAIATDGAASAFVLPVIFILGGTSLIIDSALIMVHDVEQIQKYTTQISQLNQVIAASAAAKLQFKSLINATNNAASIAESIETDFGLMSSNLTNLLNWADQAVKELPESGGVVKNPNNLIAVDIDAANTQWQSAQKIASSLINKIGNLTPQTPPSNAHGVPPKTKFSSQGGTAQLFAASLPTLTSTPPQRLSNAELTPNPHVVALSTQLSTIKADAAKLKQAATLSSGVVANGVADLTQTITAITPAVTSVDSLINELSTIGSKWLPTLQAIDKQAASSGQSAAWVAGAVQDIADVVQALHNDLTSGDAAKQDVGTLMTAATSALGDITQLKNSDQSAIDALNSSMSSLSAQIQQAKANPPAPPNPGPCPSEQGENTDNNYYGQQLRNWQNQLSADQSALATDQSKLEPLSAQLTWLTTVHSVASSLSLKAVQLLSSVEMVSAQFQSTANYLKPLEASENGQASRYWKTNSKYLETCLTVMMGSSSTSSQITALMATPAPLDHLGYLLQSVHSTQVPDLCASFIATTSNAATCGNAAQLIISQPTVNLALVPEVATEQVRFQQSCKALIETYNQNIMGLVTNVSGYATDMGKLLENVSASTSADEVQKTLKTIITQLTTWAGSVSSTRHIFQQFLDASLRTTAAVLEQVCAPKVAEEYDGPNGKLAQIQKIILALQTAVNQDVSTISNQSFDVLGAIITENLSVGLDYVSSQIPISGQFSAVIVDQVKASASSKLKDVQKQAEEKLEEVQEGSVYKKASTDVAELSAAITEQAKISSELTSFSFISNQVSLLDRHADDLIEKLKTLETQLSGCSLSLNVLNSKLGTGTISLAECVSDLGGYKDELSKLIVLGNNLTSSWADSSPNS